MIGGPSDHEADLIGGLERNLGIIKAQTKGLSHADCLLQLPFRGNCLNWVLGHIADNRNTMLRLLGEEAILSEALAKRYGYNSEPVCGDAGDILTLEQLLTVLEQSQSALTARLQNTTAEELAGEVQSFLGPPRLASSSSFCSGTRPTTRASPSSCANWPGRTTK